MPFEVTFDNLPAGVSMTAVRRGETATVLMTEFVSTEDGQQFVDRLEGFVDSALRLIPESKQPLPSQIDHMLVIVRPDRSATIYVNELAISGRIRAARAIKKGEAIGLDDMSDIVELDIGIDVPADAGVMFLVSQRWRRGLYYDWRPLAPDSCQQRTEDLRVVFAQMFAHLIFQEFHSLTEDDWRGFFAEQWFPFKSLKRNILLKMRSHVRAGWGIDELLPEIIEQVKASIDSWVETWAQDDIFSVHAQVFAQARDHLLNGDHLSATHLIYPHIEGILRTSMQKGVVKPNQKTMAEHASKTLAHLPRSLLLPRHFTRYLEDIYFADFDPDEPDAKVSRNTISHGVASLEQCNEKAAVIGFLIARHLSLCLHP